MAGTAGHTGAEEPSISSRARDRRLRNAARYLQDRPPFAGSSRPPRVRDRDREHSSIPVRAGKLHSFTNTSCSVPVVPLLLELIEGRASWRSLPERPLRERSSKSEVQDP